MKSGTAPSSSTASRLIKTRHRAGFTLEAGQPLGILRKLLGQDLERHVSFETRVASPEDLTHPARA